MDFGPVNQVYWLHLMWSSCSLFHYHRTQCFSTYSLKDGDHGINCAYRFRPYLMDRVITPCPFFFLLSFCTLLYTFLREKADDVLIWNNLSNGWASHLERWCQRRARVAAGEDSGVPLPPAHTPASANPVSWCLSHSLSGWLNSCSSADS